MRSGDHRCPMPVLAFVLGWLTCGAGVEADGPPVNDDCAGRQVLSCNDSVTVDTLLATHGANDPDLSCSSTNEPCTVFYELVPSQTSARIRTDLSSTASDSVYALYAVDQLDVCNQILWTEVDCSEDEGIGENGDLCFDDLTPGDIYILMLTGFSAMASCGEYTVDVECPCVVAPSNDDCAGREVLSCDDSVTVDTLLATHGANDPDLSCSSTDEPCTVFYEFLPSQTSARIRPDLSSTASDSVYALYAVDQLDVCNQTLWTEIDCSEDEGIGENGDLCFDTLTVGGIYILMLTGFSATASCGEYTVDIQCPCPGVSPIPTTSEWGMIVLAALLLTAGALVIAQRQRWVAR